MIEPNTARTLKAGVTACSAAVTAALGGVGWLVLLFLAAMTVDYITGSAAAMKKGEWSSAAARQGLWHKGGMIAAAVGAGGFDLTAGLLIESMPGLGLPFDYPALALSLVLSWYILTEIGSVMENAETLGAPVPPFFEKMLAVVTRQLEEKTDFEDDEDQDAAHVVLKK